MDGHTEKEYIHLDRKAGKGRKISGDIDVDGRIFLLSNFA
jgi:hypothetical protein